VNERGFSLVESLCALAILLVALVGVVPTFYVLVNVDTLSERRSMAVAAAQQVMEALRQASPSSLPSSGSSAVQTVSVGRNDYEVTAHYCTRSAFCSADSRHIVLEVSFGGRNVYIVETVYTRLQ
jgi:prepilin-type N-terminal cleavage/methylation domain-containing protein